MQQVGTTLDLTYVLKGFGKQVKQHFLDVRVFNPNATRYAKPELSKSYKINGKEKKKYYNERITQIEHGSFTPLVLSATGGMSKECQTFYVPLSGTLQYDSNMD